VVACYDVSVAVMVGIHGMGQQYMGERVLHAQWLPALKDGLAAAGHRTLSDAVRDEDVRVAFFGRAFLPLEALGTEFPLTPTDVNSPAEIELITALYSEALTREPPSAPSEGALEPVKVGVSAMLALLNRSHAFSGRIPTRAFTGILKPVIRFLTDSVLKDKVLDRVHEEVDCSTRVLIGHSLGSVVAYEYLCRYQPPGVELLVTLGSPLGIPNVVFDRLTPAPGPAGGIWPAAVTTWVNVADPDDVVALRKDLADLFPPMPGAARVSDRLVDNGPRPHSIYHYLAKAQTGSALATVL
jgi:hypothetical protein